MSELFDTHTHLYLPEFDDDGGGEAAVRRAIDSGVTRLMMPNVDHETVDSLLALAAAFPNNIYVAAGLHPTSVDEGWHDRVAEIMSKFSEYKAIGEVGVDLYWDKAYESAQMQAFDEQVSIAEAEDLPVIIHCREALDQTLEVLRGHPRARFVMHSFTGTAADVERIRNVSDCYFGINGIVTFKKSTLPEAIPEITLDRIVLETDSPYLAPVPHRGKRNESAYLPHVAARVADILGLSADTVAEATTSTARTFFKV